MVVIGIISYYLVIKMAGLINKKISSINYSRFSLITLTFIGILVTVINGWIGLLIFVICTILGRIAIKKKINKSHLLASLVIPTISYYL
jgi:TctA family transporter